MTADPIPPIDLNSLLDQWSEELQEAAADRWDAEQEYKAAQEELAAAKKRLKAADRRLVQACPWSPDGYSFVARLDIVRTVLITIDGEADGTGYEPECTMTVIPWIHEMAKIRLDQDTVPMSELSEGQANG